METGIHHLDPSDIARTDKLWRRRRIMWQFVMFLIVGLFMLVVVVSIITRQRAGAPLVTAVEPPTVLPGEVVTALGRELGESRVAEIQLTGPQGRWKAEMVSQSRSAVRFKVPRQVEPGRLLLVIKTTDPPQWIEQPASLVVRRPP
jgi:hypothetical protein